MERDINFECHKLRIAMAPFFRSFLLLVILSLSIFTKTNAHGHDDSVEDILRGSGLSISASGSVSSGDDSSDSGKSDGGNGGTTKVMNNGDSSASPSDDKSGGGTTKVMNDRDSSASPSDDKSGGTTKVMNDKDSSASHASSPSDDKSGGGGSSAGGSEKPKIETNFPGEWRIVQQNVGVAAMQLQSMPNDKFVWFDTTYLGPSALKWTPPGNCPINFETNVPDCFVHAIEYDGLKDTVRPLNIKADPWCSTGSLSASGSLIGSGGYYKGRNALRILKSCPNCDFIEKSFVLGSDRWYASQHILEDGNIVIVGGRKSFTYEIIPPDTLDFPVKQFDLPFLKDTTDPVENNLYPFLYLTPDGNLFLFANNRAIVFEAKTAQVLREMPPLPGGSRNYPASAMSALLPIKIDPKAPEKICFEVLICGGASPDAFFPVDSVTTRPKPKNVYWPALQDCGKINVNDQNPKWEKDMMLSPRVMGDMLILPTGDLLLLNGAKKGTSGWWNGDEPNMTPELYMPRNDLGKRFKQLAPTTIPRMYHSSSALVSNGEVLVAGSNENDRYVFSGVPFPTELRVEKFKPPYLDPALDKNRPKILSEPEKVKHGGPFSFKYGFVNGAPKDPVEDCDLKLTLLSPPFTTHGYSQQQRMLILDLKVKGPDLVEAVAPPNPRIAPPGYYMMFLLYRGVPSTAHWVRVVSK